MDSLTFRPPRRWLLLVTGVWSLVVVLRLQLRAVKRRHDPEWNYELRVENLGPAIKQNNRGLLQRKRGREENDSRIVGGTASTSISQRVIGGTTVQPVNRYPYMVVLTDENEGYISGASLIAPNVVLTAAHATVRDIAYVSIGRFDLSNPDEVYERIRVTRVELNPNFRPRSFNHDAALLQLERPSAFPPVTLNWDPAVPVAGTNLTVMGWGVTETGRLSNVLLETEVSAITNEQCEASSYLDEEITNAMLCARADGKDACDGDSGGPLIRRADGSADSVDPSLDLQVGIVSFGRGCASPDYPGVYTRLSFMSGWIRKTVCEMSPTLGCPLMVPECSDDTSTFLSNAGESHDCAWVYRRSVLRCPLYGAMHCPVACNMCAELIVNPANQTMQGNA